MPRGGVCERRKGDGERLACLLFDNLKGVLLAQMGLYEEKKRLRLVSGDYFRQGKLFEICLSQTHVPFVA